MVLISYAVILATLPPASTDSLFDGEGRGFFESLGVAVKLLKEAPASMIAVVFVPGMGVYVVVYVLLLLSELAYIAVSLVLALLVGQSVEAAFKDVLLAWIWALIIVLLPYVFVIGFGMFAVTAMLEKLVAVNYLHARAVAAHEGQDAMVTPETVMGYAPIME